MSQVGQKSFIVELSSCCACVVFSSFGRSVSAREALQANVPPPAGKSAGMPNALHGKARREKPCREHLATTATLFRLAQRIRASKGSKGLPRKINPVPDCSSGVRLGHSRHCELISCLTTTVVMVPLPWAALKPPITATVFAVMVMHGSMREFFLKTLYIYYTTGFGNCRDQRV